MTEPPPMPKQAREEARRRHRRRGRARGRRVHSEAQPAPKSAPLVSIKWGPWIPAFTIQRRTGPWKCAIAVILSEAKDLIWLEDEILRFAQDDIHLKQRNSRAHALGLRRNENTGGIPLHESPPNALHHAPSLFRMTFISAAVTGVIERRLPRYRDNHGFKTFGAAHFFERKQARFLGQLHIHQHPTRRLARGWLWGRSICSSCRTAFHPDRLPC